MQGFSTVLIEQNLAPLEGLGVGMCKAISVKSAVPKSAVDGAKKCGRELQ